MESNVNVFDKPVDAFDIIRQKSLSSDENDDPVYICNMSDIIQKHRTWKMCMPQVLPFYAVKANDDPVVIKMLSTLGAGFDCASKGEIEKVMSHGVDPESIIYAHPAKQISHLKLAAEQKVELMTIDSDFELQKIAKYYPTAKLVLRIRFEAKASYRPLGMKFGCNIETEAPHLIESSKRLGLNMVGISFHVGSGCMDPPVFAKAIEAARKLFDLAENVGYQFNLLDIGGGFPGVNNTDIEEFASIINRSIELHFPSPDVTIIAEPGRYYVTSAFTLACRVHSKRELRENGKFSSMMYFINEGVFGSFSSVLSWKIFNPDLKIVHPLTLKPATQEMFRSSLWGNTCDGVDELCQDVLLPDLDFNDFVIFENMGAYAIATATTFNGYPLAKVEYYVEHKDWEKMNTKKD